MISNVILRNFNIIKNVNYSMLKNLRITKICTWEALINRMMKVNMRILTPADSG